MIVRPADGFLHLITQPDHAHLARRIMEDCVPLHGHPRRRDILLAIGEHDNGWAEEDAAPRVDPATGAVQDFVNVAIDARHAVWPRGVARLAADPWAAALVAQHALTVYSRFDAVPEWTSFFVGMAARRDEMLRTSGGALEDLTGDYVFVRLADLISLVFCTGWTEEQRFADWRVHRSGDRVLVTPDPFGGRTIPVEIVAREIPDRPFDSDAELHRTLAAAAATTLFGEVAGGERLS